MNPQTKFQSKCKTITNRKIGKIKGFKAKATERAIANEPLLKLS